MHKRGMSGLEFILAFVLFVGFTVAALWIFNPVGSPKTLEYSGEYTLKKIISNTSVGLESYSIAIPVDADKILIYVSGINSNKGVSAVDYSGQILSSAKSGGGYCIGVNNKKFVNLYFSEDIISGSDSSCNSGEYEVASSLNESVISEKRISSLKASYESNYLELKNQLGIPNEVDFSFSLEFSTNDKISAGNVKSFGEIFSKTERKEVLRESNGIPQFGQLTVKVW